MLDLRRRFQNEFEEHKRIQNLCRCAIFRSDFLENLEEFQNFTISGMNCIIRSFQSCPEDYIDWIVDLTARNMMCFYKDAWGWSTKSKQFEVMEEDACFLIAVIGDNPIGFIHFKFEEQDNMFTLFIYNIEVAEEYQKNGLGTFLMSAVESIGKEIKVDCLMTMLFKANELGLEFFRKNGFISSPISPENLNAEKSDLFKHLILYKLINNKNT